MTLKYLGQAAAQQSVIEKSTKRFAEKTLSVLRVAFVSGLSLELIASVSIALIAVETGLRLMSGMMDYQYALFVLILAPEFYQPLRALGSSYHAGVEGATAMDKISEMVSGDISRKAAISAVKSMIQPPFEIRFEKVSYQYPGAKKSALEGASFTIYPNKLNALIGPSGSGKSTVSNLVLKWLTLDEGRIKVNGHPLEEIPEESWMSYISWISQHPHLFHGTIRENILAGKPGASADEFKRAVQMASLEEWIAELPAGTETMIGERGMKISQGQIQRIAIARAFLKNAPLMIFDEPANYLDPDNEGRIAESIRRISPGKTLLVIAHRLKTVMESAHVILLNDGRCVAEGTYQELYNHVTEYRERFQRLTGGHDAAD